ncbi:MAG: replication-associated recombination protein A [Candidatus Eisenbacteria bacterium]|uniref:Replication-associated recombination protein A n=1 Tax=Eiseniibacteriota bacterium TaxID=2212470 RepID=A0A849SNG8_UNCEI|nr:replication-associated recombination protein A [Candidatus Eisenbacteria bacterium]
MSGDLFGSSPGPPARAPGSAASEPTAGAPLADRMRPRTFEELIGQEHLLEPGSPLALMRAGTLLPSIILWGPPGTGKTTIARLIALTAQAPFVGYSAVLAGVKEIKETMARAALERKRTGRPTVLFLDEIHRFNRAQQDAFLSHVEAGDIVLIGATTENPSFEVNAALLSRARVLVLKQLEPEHMRVVVERALADVGRGFAGKVAIAEDALALLAQAADGDARRALNTLEIAVATATERARQGHPATAAAIALEDVRQALQRRHLRYDRAGEEHFNLISALHKSLRDSDPHAGLYWLARMLAAGEDPLYVARRLVRFASEDVGNADPQALPLAVAAFQAYHQLGTPEGELALAQCCVYLATAPKSNAIYKGFGRAIAEIEASGSLPPPKVILNAPTRLMKDLGYGANYRYAHDEAGAIADQQHLPDELEGRRFYEPTERGYEAEVSKRMREWDAALRKPPA